MRDKGNELREWHGKQFQVLLRQHEMISMEKEDVAAREARLAERTTLLDTKDKDMSSREQNLEDALRGKDEELQAFV